MRVSDTTIGAGSATLTKHAPISVKVTQDANFIRMMSTNLYSNQLLAALREPCCNAWDAHIEAGKTDIPLIVTLTADGVLTIKDSGLGIPHDKIGDIYGTYGLSTKTNNDGVTGGFGLGSKAPFAAVDSFRVTSCYGGERNVYNMVSSDITSDGLPNIIPVVLGVPCGDEVGLTVQMHLRENDIRTAEEYQHSILRTGGMVYEFTSMGNTVKSVDNPVFLNPEPGSYSLNPVIDEDYCTSASGIFIRYGTVVYPALVEPSTERALKMLGNFMDILNAESIVIQAAPGTLGLVPSRESFTRSELTTNGIVKLCTDLVDRMEKEILEELPTVLAEGLETARTMGKKVRFLSDMFVGMTAHTVLKPGACLQYFTSNLYGNTERTEYLSKAFRIYDQTARTVMRKLYGSRMFDMMKKGEHRSHRNKARFPWDRDSDSYPAKLITRHVDHKILRKLTPIYKELRNGSTKLNVEITNSVLPAIYNSCEQSINASHLKLLNTTDKDILYVLYTNGKRKFDSVSYYYKEHDTKRIAVYIRLPTKKAPADTVRNHIKSLGGTYLDLTEKHSWDYPRIRQEERRQAELASRPTTVVVASEVKPKPVLKDKGLFATGLSLGALISKSRRARGNVRGLAVNTDLFHVRNATRNIRHGVRCDKPKYFWFHPESTSRVLESKHNLSVVDALPMTSTMPLWVLTKEELDSTVLVRNVSDLKYVMKHDLRNISSLVIPRIVDMVLSPEFKQYLTYGRQIELRGVLDRKSREILTEIGVKLPDMDKLSFNPRYENLIDDVIGRHLSYNITRHTDIMVNPNHSPEFIREAFDELTAIRNGRSQIAVIKVLNMIDKDPIASRLDWERLWDKSEGIYRPIIKSAIKLAIKLGKQNEQTSSGGPVS